MNLNIFVSDNKCSNHAYKGIHTGKNKFKTDNVADVLFQQLMMLCNIFVVEVGDTQVKENIQDHRETEQWEV